MKHKLPFTKINYIIFIIGLILLSLGYFLMSIGPHDSFYSLTLSPIILCLVYVIIFPLAIFFKKNIDK